MKKRLALIVIACALGLIACGQNNPSSSSSRRPEDESSSTSTSVENIPVTGVTISDKNLELSINETRQLSSTIIPLNATNQNVKWQSLDESVASVTNAGLVKGLSVGTTNILVTTVDGLFTDSCSVTVKGSSPSVISVTGVSLNKKTLSLVAGSQETLTATVEPSNATNQTVIWSTSNENVARVAFGQVSAMGPGSATITVKTEDGNKTDTCLVTVTGEVVKVRAFSIAPTSATIYVGETVTLEASFLPANPTNKTVFWSSDKPNIASVNDGVVTGVGQGSAVIQGKTEDGNFTATCTVTVNKRAEYVKGYVTDEMGFIDVVQTQNNGTYISAGSSSDDNGKYFNFIKGAMGKIIVKKIDNYKVTSIMVDEVDYPLNDTSVSFMVGSTNFDIVVNYTDDIPLTGDTEIIVDTTSHIAVKLYGQDKKTEIVSANAHSKVYLKCTPISNDYAVRSVEYKYQTSSGNYTNSCYLDDATGMYYFTVPSTYDGKVRVYIEEKDMTLFRGSEFVGDYFILRTFNCTVGDKEFNNFYQYGDNYYTLTIAESGDIYLNVKPTFDEVIASYNEQENALVSDLLTYYPYKDGIAVFGYKTGNYFSAPFKETKDTYVAIKKNDSNDLPSDYSFHNQIVTLDGVTYLMGQVSYKGNPYKNFLINVNERTLETNVTYDVFYGNNIDEDKSCYYVKVGGGIVLSVGYKHEGGPKNRVLLSGLAGLYRCGSDILVMPNEEELFYNGNEMIIYGIRDNTIIFYNNQHYYTATLNKENSEFSIVTSKNVNPGDVSFKGLEFNGSFVEEGSGNTPLKLTFDNYQSGITGNLKIGNYPAYNVGFTAVYNPETFIITFTVVSKDVNHSDIPIGGTFVGLVTNHQIMFKRSFTTFRVFNFQYSVVTCPSFNLDLGLSD